MSEKNFVLAIDQGTTGSTALIVEFTEHISVVSRKNVEFPQHYPKPGWVEHDLDEIWASVKEAVSGAMLAAQSKISSFSPKALKAIGITNQRETLCAYEPKTGRPLSRAIVWQCRRSNEICQIMRKEGLEETITERTGLVLDPYFTGSKLRWLMENNPQLRAKALNGEVFFSTIESFLLYRLTNAKAFATEPSNASRTLLFDIKQGTYASDLLELFRCPRIECLPEVKDSAGLFGLTEGLGFLPDGIPITGILGDQQAALAGQGCFEPGDAKCTYGTGAFLLLNTGKQKIRSSARLLTTVSWRINSELYYCFEGASFIAGAAVQFLRDQMGFLHKASESEAMAKDVLAAPELYFVPALVGLGAPYWNASARGAFFGLTRGTDRRQLVRAAIEAIAFQVCDLLTAMAHDAKSSEGIKVLRADGGACENNLLMQLQSDLSGLNVERSANLETTAIGAAMFAALGVGIYSDFSQLAAVRRTDRSFSPTPGADAWRNEWLSGWQRAIDAVQVFSVKK